MNFDLRNGLAGCAFLLLGCSGDGKPSVPTFADGGLLRTAEKPTRARLLELEGKFDVETGTDLFGADVVVRTSPNTLSIASGKNGRYGVLHPGCRSDGTAIFEGYWHDPREERFGLLRLQASDAGAARLCGASSPVEDALVLRGDFGSEDETPTRDLVLRRSGPLLPFRGTFFTMAHHGACENTESCGASSNSLETIRLVEQVAGNAVEVDIRVTRDGVPVLFHDPSLSASLVEGAFCRGAVADLSLAELRENCRLEHGEILPTLDEALRTAREDTELEAVYVDVKVPEAVDPAAAIIAQHNEQARADGREFRAVIALTKDSVTEAWLKEPRPKSVPCLLEYDPDLVLDLGCVAWGPTWTAGPQVPEVERLHQAGKRVVYWTLNQTEFIETFLREARPDGIITSRTALVFYLYQKQGSLPGLVTEQP